MDQSQKNRKQKATDGAKQWKKTKEMRVYAHKKIEITFGDCERGSLTKCQMVQFMEAHFCRYGSYYHIDVCFTGSVAVLHGSFFKIPLKMLQKQSKNNLFYIIYKAE